jgi:hypothetical protein
MSREEMITELILQGWEPFSAYAITHRVHGLVRCTDEKFEDMCCLVTYLYTERQAAYTARSIGWCWDDIEDLALRSLHYRVNSFMGRML